MINLTSKQLRQAANLKEKIVALEKELNQLFGSTGKPVASPAPKKRKMSAAGRANIRAAVKARWAKQKGLKLSAKPVKKARRKMSAAARAKIAAAAKARWKTAKAQGKNSL
jgi:hypothetical protein